jgi:RimJ/RimL family protein N-acetyltransferase
LIAGRDEQSQRWLGPGDAEPRPTACILLGGEIVGWVGYDTDQEWLSPGEVNIGYHVFAPHRERGYATRAVRLLLRHLQEGTGAERAHFVIEEENTASQRVTRSVGAHLVEPKARLSGRQNLWYAVELHDFPACRYFWDS